MNKTQAPQTENVPTTEMIDALRQVENGADVFHYGLAGTLRQIEREFPALIDITKAMGDYDGVSQLPYFGAIATQAGIDLVRAEARDPEDLDTCPDCGVLLVMGFCESCEDGVEVE